MCKIKKVGNLTGVKHLTNSMSAHEWNLCHFREFSTFTFLVCPSSWFARPNVIWCSRLALRFTLESQKMSSNGWWHYSSQSSFPARDYIKELFCTWLIAFQDRLNLRVFPTLVCRRWLGWRWKMSIKSKVKWYKY